MPHLRAGRRGIVVGFLIRESQSAVQLLDIGPGMSVLYGLNGAGKSRTLTDINRFFLGLESDALALVQLSRARTGIDWYGEVDSVDWFPDWARRAGMSAGDHDEILSAWVNGCLSADEVTVPTVPDTSTVHRPDRMAALVQEWLEHPLLLVRALGSERQRRWASAPAFLTSLDKPSSADEVELFEAWDEFDPSQGNHFAEIALTPFGITSDGRTVACASHAGQAALDDDQVDLSAGVHDRLLDVSPSLFASDESVDDQTRRHLVSYVSSTVVVEGHLAQASPELLDRVSRLETLANQHSLGVLQEAPILRLHVDPVGLGQQVQWYAAEDDSVDDTTNGASDAPADCVLGQHVEPVLSAEDLLLVRTLDGLSTAQRRWADWSIRMAIGVLEGLTPDLPTPSSDILLLLDEPEAALHRSAEAQMARYLNELAGASGVHLVVATHSPELLETATARVFEVSRRNGRRWLQGLDSISRENMTDLGLQPSDLLRRQRGFIIVEGMHDEVVLQTLFGDQMRRLRVETLPLRGTTELSPAKIGFLFDYTPAHVFVMLDNIKGSELGDIWVHALDRLGEGKAANAETLIKSAPCLQTDEGKKLSKVLVEVLMKRDASRVTPHGLSRLDIVDYLPVEALVPTDKSWPELRELHRERRKSTPGTAGDFKRWLELDWRADFGPDAIRDACGRLDTVPPELRQLWSTVEANVSG